MPLTSTTLRELRPTLALAMPITAGHVGQIMLGVADTMMIGRVGTAPLAAAGLASFFFSVFYIVAIGLLTSVSVRTAFEFGARRFQGAADVLRHGLVIALFASLIGGGCLHVLADFLHLFGQPPEVVREARSYLVIIAWTLVPALLFLALKQFYEALNRPWAPMRWVLVGVLANVFLNWVLIYGHLGAPALGLDGAGWATLIARVITLLGLGAEFLLSDDAAPVRPARWFDALRKREFRELFALGWPAAVQLLFEVGLFSLAGLFMGWLGTVALAAHQVALTCAATAFMFPLGISHALSVRIGQARGADAQGWLRPIGLGGIGAGALIMAAFAVTFLVGGRFIASLFIEDPEVIAMTAQLLIVAGVFQIFDGTQVTSIGALRGLADVRTPTLVTFVGYWVLALPAAWILAFPAGVGPIGVWLGLMLGLAACAAALLMRFIRLTRAPVAG